MDRVVTQIDAEDGTTRLGYDEVGNAVSKTDPVGVVTAFTFDARDLMVATVENSVPGAE